jgi:predicted oxidoreductase
MNNLSKIIAGTMTWGSWGKNLDTVAMANMIKICLESGINTFDHADIYGGYTTESGFGAGFQQSGVSRSDIRLISKCGIQYPAENRPLPIKHYDYSVNHIKWSVENSLRNLKTDYLDLLLLHRPSPLMQAEEIASVVADLKKEGKILGFGVSNFTPSQTELIRKQTDVSYNQIQFSLTHLEALTDGSLDYMQLNNIQPMAWNPLGVVFKEDIDQTKRLKILLSELEDKYNAPSDILLLAWILKHPAGITPVCGTTSPERIKQLRLATTIELETVDWFSLWVESRGSKVP